MSRRRQHLMLLALSGLCLSMAAGTAPAQPAPPAQLPETVPDATEPPGQTMPADPAPDAGGDNPPSSLTEKLERNDGVLKPPTGIDPEIREPIPEDFNSSMPVIPPPNQSQENQIEQPK